MEIYLRPFKETDWEEYLSWHTEKTKWMEYDAPWEKDEMELEGIKKDFKRQLEISQRTIPSRLAISFNDGKAIGSVNSYYIDGDSKKRAVGIGICDDNYWSMGIGEKALRKWIDFWLDEQELETLYCETCSGNIPMMKLAEKVGFVELEREKNIRRVRGKDYDGITYLYTR